jgi:hypothetical protein
MLQSGRSSPRSGERDRQSRNPPPWVAARIAPLKPTRRLGAHAPPQARSLCHFSHPPEHRREQMALEWLPEQVAGWLKHEFPNQDTIWAFPSPAHDTASTMASTAGQPRGQIIEGRFIRDSSAEVEDRAIPRSRGGDLITGHRIYRHPGRTAVAFYDAVKVRAKTYPAWRRR